jgi:ubiquinone biosynthesis protein COQ9
MTAKARDLKQAIVAAALVHAAQDGFSDKLLRHAAADAGAAEADMAHLFPNGVASLLEAYSTQVDAEMEKRLVKAKLSAMPVRKRIATAVMTRLGVLEPHKDAVRRAVAWLSLPPNVPLGAQLVYCTVDAMWRAAGDLSTDFNFYTKRAILAGVYSATVMRWLTSDDEATRAFLDARIENVMQFEKFKAKLRDGARQGFARMSEALRTARGP